MLERQEGSLSLLHAILSAERETKAEISQLQSFPSQEVGVIRKELRGLREKQEQTFQSSPAPSTTSADLLSSHYDNLITLLRDELQLTERKLQLLRERRESEEEVRAQQNKRLARARAIEELESRDPNNFRNQSGRFN
jgi:hypothetical protein